MVRYKQNVVKHDKTDEIICPEGTSFLQFVSDNTDHDLATLDGKNTHHGLGTIAIANGKFSDCQTQRQRVPRDKVEKWSDIESNSGIKIVQYFAPQYSCINKNSSTTNSSGKAIVGNKIPFFSILLFYYYFPESISVVQDYHVT